MKRRVLPADVYDAMEFSALTYGGIGKGRLYDNDGDVVPCCAIGHALFAQTINGEEWVSGSMVRALWDSGIGGHTSDRAVGKDLRIPFAEWCRRLNVVRGAP